MFSISLKALSGWHTLHTLIIPLLAAGLLSFIQQSGIMFTDRRISHTVKRIQECVKHGGSLNLQSFTDIIRWLPGWTLRAINRRQHAVRILLAAHAFRPPPDAG